MNLLSTSSRRRCLLLNVAVWVAVWLPAAGCQDGALQSTRDSSPSDGRARPRDVGTVDQQSTGLDVSLVDATQPRDGAAPRVDAPRSKLDGPPPKLDSSKPKLDTPKPTPDAVKPKLDGPAPKLDAPKPTPDAPQPTIDAPAPKPDAPKPTLDAPPGFDFKPLYTGSFPQGKGDLSATLTVGGFTRAVSIYRPAALPAKPPLMVLFHGTNGNPWSVIGPGGTYARELADQQGLVLVAPQARQMTAPDWDNHVAGDVYWQSYPSVDPTTNPDLLLVQAIIDEATKAYGVDAKRVYVLGHSSGAFFTILVATSLPNRIAAFVENAGGLVRCAGMKDCTFQGSGTSCAGLAAQPGWCSCSGPVKPGPIPATGRKPPGYLSHSSDDSVVSVYYTCQLASQLAALGYTTSLQLGSSFGHSFPPNLALNAWPFLSTFAVP